MLLRKNRQDANKMVYSIRDKDNSVEDQESALNPYAAIITNEAHRRGIEVTVLDAEHSYFSLTLGEHSIVCQESLCELATAIAMSRCDHKVVTLKLLDQAGLHVPAQTVSGSDSDNQAFLEQYQHIVVKPAHGEQGNGVSVDICNMADLDGAIEYARRISEPVLLEEFISGEDLRVIVIADEVVAAAVRRPPVISGDGEHSIIELINLQSRRREQATAGESHIPLDTETERCVKANGYGMSDVLPRGKHLTVRKTDNVHTGGTIEDTTDQLHPNVREAAILAAQAIDIPVVGIDFIVPAVDSSEYVIIEANERPGLANHEPQPTAQRFIDLLFPETRAC